MKTPQEMVIEALQEVGEVSVNELSTLLAADPHIHVLDVREPQEVEQGVIPKSTWIPRGMLEFQIWNLVDQLGWDPADPIYLYCRSGNRSALAAKTLKDMGFTQPNSVAGGFTAWKDSGYPIAFRTLHF